MKGVTHTAGALAVRESLKMPLSIFYLAIVPSYLEVVVFYQLYDVITTKPTLIGAVLPDYDQTEWEYTPNRLPKKLGMFYFRLLKSMGAKHRSTHSHNLDLWTILLGVPAFFFIGLFITNSRPPVFYLGVWILVLYASVLSHQFLDTLTVAGTNQSHIKTVILGLRNKKRSREDTLSIKPLDKTVKSGTFYSQSFKNDADWGRTGSEWEEAIYFKINNYIVSKRRWKRKIIDLFILFQIYVIVSSF